MRDRGRLIEFELPPLGRWERRIASPDLQIRKIHPISELQMRNGARSKGTYRTHDVLKRLHFVCALYAPDILCTRPYKRFEGLDILLITKTFCNLAPTCWCGG